MVSHENASGEVEKGLAIKPAPAMESRKYVVLVSGTMNPPHKGHVRLGLHAARHLKELKHEVQAICFVPVHDNYLHNKVALKKGENNNGLSSETLCFPSEQRCDMLKTLLACERERYPEEAGISHVVNYELSNGSELLEESPNYWAPKLPDGYFRTVPTNALINHFAANSPLLPSGARVAVTFGVDNLAGMAHWNDPAKLLLASDLVFVGRDMSQVTFGKDPCELLNAIKHFEIKTAVPVDFGGKTIFGADTGSFENVHADGNGALVLLPPLDGGDEDLSSTKIRNGVVSCLQMLSKHGYGPNPGDILPVLQGAADGPKNLAQVEEKARDRGELVNPAKRLKTL